MKVNLIIDNNEIKKNLETLFSIKAGSVPSDREFGINWACLDQPKEIAENQFILEVHKKVKMYEPRVKIIKIDFTYKDGRLEPSIYFGGADG